MRLKKGTYTTDNSDLEIVIHAVRYQSETYAKVRATLQNKKNGIIYEHKNYKLIKERIRNWRLK